MDRIRSLPLILITMALAGCAAPSAKTAVPPLQCRGTEFNGPLLNGTELSRDVAPCPPLTGLQLHKVSLQAGVALPDGTLLSDVVVTGATLRSATAGAVPAGAMMLGRAQGFSLRLRLDEVAQASQASQAFGADLPLYAVSYQWGSGDDPSDRRFAPTTDWAPLCKNGAKALWLPGRWDYAEGGRARKVSAEPTDHTVACQGSAIAKCVEKRGYLPWQTVTRDVGGEKLQVSVDDLHQACVRATRADYCGDGVSLTVEGRPLDLYDSVGMQKDTEDWTFEAEWTADGARCITDPRLLTVPGQPGTSVRDYLSRHCPDRLASQKTPCRSPAGVAGSVLWTEHPPR